MDTTSGGDVTIPRHRTAIRRYQLSRPMRLALETGLISRGASVFDYGCGHGDDIRLLREQGLDCAGWDPIYMPSAERVPADIVNLGYVINVIEDSEERAAALCGAWSLANRLLIVSARLSGELASFSTIPYCDGCLTQSGTFQKFYEQQELRDWIDALLDAKSIAAAPGVFYAFRDPELRQSYEASRYRRKISAPRQRHADRIFEENRKLFDVLMDFITLRGRLPAEAELDIVPAIRGKIGSLNRAFTIIKQATGGEQWERIVEERAQDLLIYFALARFAGRPPLSGLPPDLQLDIRAFFSSYQNASRRADELLFSAGDSQVIQAACRKATVGKLTSDALYIHASALPLLPPILRVYEGCARNYVGSVEGANIIKLHCGKPQISYLQYPEFEKNPHPALAASLVVPLQTFRIKYREYKDSPNPPILHRKELFIAQEHPLYAKFARLTRQEEKYCLFDSSETIGTREGWQKMLESRGVYFSGHRLLRRKAQAEQSDP